MHIHIHSHMQNPSPLDRERRLLWINAPEVQKKIEQGANTFGALLVEYIKEPVFETAKSVYQGLNDAWVSDPNDLLNNERREAVRAIHMFSLSAPRELFDKMADYMKKERVSDPATIIQLTQMDGWLLAMQSPDAFKDTDRNKTGNEDVDKYALPESLFLSWNAREQKRIFIATLDATVPQRYQEKKEAKDPLIDDDAKTIMEGGFIQMKVNAPVSLSEGGKVLEDAPGSVVEDPASKLRVTRIDATTIMVEAKEIGGENIETAQLFLMDKPLDIDIVNVKRTVNEGESITLPASQKTPGVPFFDKVSINDEEKKLVLDNGKPTGFTGPGATPLECKYDDRGNLIFKALPIKEDSIAKVNINGKEYFILIKDTKRDKMYDVRFNETKPEDLKRQQRIMELVMGTKRPGDITDMTPAELAEAEVAAKATLRSRYPEKDDDNATRDTRQADIKLRLTQQLRDDYVEALRYVGNSLPAGGAVDPLLLAARLPASQFKGALNLGIIDQSTLEAMGGMNPDLVNSQRDRADKTAESRKQFDDLTQLTKREQREKAKTMMDVWDNLSGAEKLVAIAAAGYLAYRYRGAALAVAGGYFFMKFVMKVDKPFDKSAQVINDTINKAREKNEEIFGFGGPSRGAKELLDQSDVIAQFLSPIDQGKLEVQTLGFMLLQEVPMDVIANNFVINNGAFSLETPQNGGVQGAIRNELKKRGLRSSRIDEFFSNPENKAQMDEAASYLFFTVMKRKYPSDPRVRQVEAAMKGRMTKTGMVALRDSDPAAYDAYVSLVSQGRNDSLTNSKKVGDFQRAGFVAGEGPNAKDIEARRNLRIETTQTAMKAYAPDLQLTFTKLNGNIQVATAITGKDEYGLSLPETDFEKKQPKDILKEWKLYVLGEYKKGVEAAALGVPFEFQIDEKDTVFYEAKGARNVKAKTPLKEMLKRTPATVEERYREWALKTPADRLTEDPLRERVMENMRDIPGLIRPPVKIEENANGTFTLTTEIGDASSGSANTFSKILTFDQFDRDQIVVAKEFREATLQKMIEYVNQKATPAEFAADLGPDGKTAQYWYTKDISGNAVTKTAGDTAKTDAGDLLAKDPKVIAGKYEDWRSLGAFPVTGKENPFDI